jgi:predicted DNA-binding protein
MKIEKKEVKSKAVSTKVTELKNQKLETLAKKKGVTKSSLIEQLISIGYEQVTKKPL